MSKKKNIIIRQKEYISIVIPHTQCLGFLLGCAEFVLYAILFLVGECVNERCILGQGYLSDTYKYQFLHIRMYSGYTFKLKLLYLMQCQYQNHQVEDYWVTYCLFVLAFALFVIASSEFANLNDQYYIVVEM